MYNLAIIGKVSAGKSSFINSLVSKPLAPVSLQRETFFPTKYIFNTKTDITNYAEMSKKNRNLRDNNILPEMTIQTVYVNKESAYINSVTDYPGLDDHKDIRDILGVLIKNIPEYDMIIFISDANSAFVSKSEVEIYNKIKVNVEANYINGIFCDFICVITKYEQDDDMKEIFEKNAPKGSFRWNSYYVFLNLSKECKKEFSEQYGNEWKKIMRFNKPESDDSFDIDGLRNHIKNLDIKNKKSECLYKFHMNIKSYNQFIVTTSYCETLTKGKTELKKTITDFILKNDLNYTYIYTILKYTTVNNIKHKILSDINKNLCFTDDYMIDFLVSYNISFAETELPEKELKTDELRVCKKYNNTEVYKILFNKYIIYNITKKFNLEWVKDNFDLLRSTQNIDLYITTHILDNYYTITHNCPNFWKLTSVKCLCLIHPMYTDLKATTNDLVNLFSFKYNVCNISLVYKQLPEIFKKNNNIDIALVLNTLLKHYRHSGSSYSNTIPYSAFINAFKQYISLIESDNIEIIKLAKYLSTKCGWEILECDNYNQYFNDFYKTFSEIQKTHYNYIRELKSLFPNEYSLYLYKYKELIYNNLTKPLPYEDLLNFK